LLQFFSSALSVIPTIFTAMSSQKTVLITGASGFVAAHIVQVFLEAGYAVRGTVRSEATAEKVRRTYPKYADRLSFAIVPDMAQSNAFDEAVKDVDGIIHTATPFQVQVEDNERDLLRPAIEGTVNLLLAAKKYAAQVRRIVLISSFAAMLDLSKGNWPEHTYTEADWNPMTYEEADEERKPPVMQHTVRLRP
jgi:Nucleoside-diphosphate-sugar epimerases